ncbi:MAG: DUF4365 domain-containing protein [Pirellula sp.]
MSKSLTRAQRTGRLGEVQAELAVLEELGFIFHPSGTLEAGTDGFIEVCDLDTGAPLGRYIAVQVKATDTNQPNYKASRSDVEYWRGQNVPFLLLRVMRQSGTVLWKLIDKHSTAGTIRFSLEDDRLDRKAVVSIARLVDERYLRDNPEFQNHLAKIALGDAKDAFGSGDYTVAVSHCERAQRLAVDATLRVDAIYHRIEAEINHVLCTRERDSLPTKGWLAEIDAAGPLDKDIGRRPLLEARIAFVAGDYAHFQASLASARTAVSGNHTALIDFSRLALRACIPKFSGRGLQQLEEEEKFLAAIMQVAENDQRVLLLASQITTRADLDVPIDGQLSALCAAVSDYGTQGDCELAHVLFELESLVRFLRSHDQQDAAIATAQAAAQLSETRGTLRQHAETAELLAQTLTIPRKTSEEDKEAQSNRYREALSIRQNAEARILRKEGGLANLSADTLEFYLPLCANRIQDTTRFLRHEPFAQNIEEWNMLEQDCTSILDVLEAQGSSLRGDVMGVKSFLLSLEGEIAAERGRYTVAAERFQSAYVVAAKARHIPAQHRFYTACGAAYFSAVCGDHTKSDALLDEVEGFVETEEQRREFLHYRAMSGDVRQTAEWVSGPDARAITEIARRYGVRAAISQTVERLLTHWEDNGEPDTSLYDYWGRGGFQRIAAAMRGVPDDVIAVDAATLRDIEEAARLLCPLFETVLVKWKGPLAEGITMMTVQNGRDEEAGWLCGDGFANCASVGDGKYGVVGYLTSVPPEVAKWLGTQARALLAAGRLIVVPAVQVGCTQKDVGWTDDVLLSRFLRGVVVATGREQLPGVPVLNLAQVGLPYIGGPGLSMDDLAKVLEDLGDAIGPYRRRMLGILGSQGSRSLNWAQKKSIRLEIEDGIADVRKHFSMTLRHTSVDVMDSQASIDAVERNDYAGRAWMSEALHGMAELPETLRPWLPLWRFKELGGSFNWAAPLTGREVNISGLRFSWLSPPSRGVGMGAE